MYSILFIVLVLWSSHVSGLSEEFKQEEQSALSQLDTEAQTDPQYDLVWKDSKNSGTLYGSAKDLEDAYRGNGILNKAEIRILKSYCMASDFYEHLNGDVRDNDGRQYPVAIKVLQEAITKLIKYQSDIKKRLPKILYRAEPKDEQFNIYQTLLNSSKSGVLKQFTSTTSDFAEAVRFKAEKSGNMITKFEDPQLGADMYNFTDIQEYEFLLPLNAAYTVKTATKCNGEPYVVLSGPRKRARRSVQSSDDTNSNFVCPRNSGNNKHTSNIFILLVSTLIIKLV